MVQAQTQGECNQCGFSPGCEDGVRWALGKRSEVVHSLTKLALRIFAKSTANGISLPSLIFDNVEDGHDAGFSWLRATTAPFGCSNMYNDIPAELKRRASPPSPLVPPHWSGSISP
ncbi:hypothetical protein HBI56_034560 [Parastagonospora nodorum]|nr:hypothetical protein HBH53_164600 [Parastagonospora nodorum]KAH4011511.1 hypothetical protein HBI13_198530 [Parastagonospora nodorum]KAH4205754.1 hypothetical protein HBI95_130940 [Parastagonospora nodorum]KAH4234583.1 hypothetical protein HBI05_153020 [Parastagonospora nodorum]KAH4241949.1 hypothetical protein HBI06_022800 [Parastagonospora nodorum]